MEIEFNPNVGSAGAVKPALPRQGVPQPVTPDVAFQAEALERQLKDLPSVRPEVVEQARTLVADLQYPPDQVLKSLATLLALKLIN